MNKLPISKQTLSRNFTLRTVRAAVRAKKRDDNRQRFIAAIKEPFSMKSLQFLKSTPGLIAIAVVLATGSASAYALSSWFGTNVPVTQTGDILHVDLSGCSNNLPPGVPVTADKHDIKYKITGTPHLTASQLQAVLLGSCESDAIQAFYAKQIPAARFNDFSAIQANDPRLQYAVPVGKIVAISGTSVTLNYTLGAKGKYDQTKTFTLADDVTIFDKSQPVAISDLQPGDQVEFVAYAAGFTNPDETNNVTDQANVKILSLFKTQYDVTANERYLDAQNNLMPL